MTFSIIIPAYNEEDSIATIIERCLAAREAIIARTMVDEVEVIVVSDGSNDRTAELAQCYVPKIKLIAYPDNRGYGRALKIGFKKARGHLVSFLDADGTCDPFYFVDMINKLERKEADICIGSRMGPHSKMPKLRRVGNIFFRSLINLIARSDVSDSASGMRVIRKDSLPQIYPLPDGMDFTPAMTTRAVLDPSMTIVEIDMTYEERLGESKLGVVKDGIRFLKSILSVALTYRPLKLFAPPAMFLILIALSYGTASLVFYFGHSFVPEDSIYRLVSVVVFGVSGVLLLGLASLAEKAVNLIHGSAGWRVSVFGQAVRWAFSWRRLWVASPILLLAGVALNYETILSYARYQAISTHWSYVVTGGYLVLLGIVSLAIGVIDYLLDTLHERRDSVI